MIRAMDIDNCTVILSFAKRWKDLTTTNLLAYHLWHKIIASIRMTSRAKRIFVQQFSTSILDYLKKLSIYQHMNDQT